ncbi:MAG: EAL domain-containing protein, partial [Campylobacterales bacterium]|nr:EAL domain-containing protein [Campylobacterales bacterium]
MINVKELKQICKDFSLLYAEDDIGLRNVTARILLNVFEKVDLADDGADALLKYNQYYEKNGVYYDLIMTDIDMPNMSGIEFSKAILSLNNEQFIMVISAYNDSNLLEELIDMGVAGYVHKPLNYKQFIQRTYKISKLISTKKELLKKQEKIEQLNKELQDSNEILEEKVKLRTQQIENQLYIDRLTNLKSIASLQRDLKNNEFNVLFLLNIDNFSSINSLYGYEYGNEVLRQFAKCLNQFNAKNKYTIYRINSDKFALLESNNCDDIFEFENHIRALKHSIQNYVFKIEDIEFSLDATIGMSFGQEDPIVSADMALLYAQQHNLGYQAYTQELNTIQHISNNLDIRKTIRYAILHDKVFPVFQPIIDIDGNIIKYEVLMRIKDENDQVLTPENFLEVAIQSKQYNQLCNLMFAKTFKEIEKSDKLFSLNLSYEDIYNKIVVKYLIDNLENYPEASKKLVIEVLETLAITESSIMKEFMDQFIELGVRFAIDDFGTGYSNFSHILDMNPH